MAGANKSFFKVFTKSFKKVFEVDPKNNVDKVLDPTAEIPPSARGGNRFSEKC